jgi:hypothetical protein
MTKGNRARRAVVDTRRGRRIAVVLTLAVTAVLGSNLPTSFHGLAIVVVLVLATLDILLVRATGALAFTLRRTLDERETALRDRAYRRGFRLLGAALAVALLLFIASAYVLTATAGPSQNGSTPLGSQINQVISGRWLVAIVELVVMLPTLMIAWVEGDRPEEERGAPQPHLSLLWLSIPALAGAWLLVNALAPDQGTAPSLNSVETSFPGASCAHYSGGRVVGAQFGATVSLNVEVCWNGTDAFVLGDPSIPLPQSAIAARQKQLPPDVPVDNVNYPQLDLTSCGADTVDDFAMVSASTCGGTVDTSGTLHYTVRARVSVLPGGIDRRDVTLSLVVARDGRVLEQP